MTIALRDQLARWRQPGAAGFFAFLDDVRPLIPSERGGFQPFAFPNKQLREAIRAALDGGHSTIVLCWPRRHGKTILAALIIVWRFLTRETQVVAIVANSQSQTVDTAFRLVRGILDRTFYTRQLIDAGAIKLGADWITYEALDNRIQGFPSHAPALYGKRLSIAQVSELHAARSDQVYQALASSTIDSEDGLVLVDSTVGPRSSPLFALYQLAENGADPTLYFSHIQYGDLADAIANGPAWIKPERLRSRAAQMLPVEFAQQHLNQWGSGSNSLFPPEVLDRCRDTYPLDLKALADGRAYAVGGGLDRAYGFSLHGDATVTTCILKVLDGEEEHFYVLASDGIAFSSASGIKRALSRYHRDFGMSRAALESYNVQDVAAWCAEQPFAHETVFATAERQAGAFTVLYNAAAEGRLHVHPKFERLLREMGTLEYRLEIGQRGSVAKFEAAKGAHDDHVYALVWAIYSLREVELNPYEITGIHCDAPGPIAELCVLNDGDLVPHCSETCRSFQAVTSLYQQYRARAGCAPMALPDFFRSKVVNVGSHSLRR